MGLVFSFLSMKYFYLILILVFFTACNSHIQQSRQLAAETTVNSADTLLALTAILKEKIEEKVEENPNSSSADFVSVVDDKMDEVEYIQGQVRSIKEKEGFNLTAKKDLDKIRFYQEKLTKLTREIGAINTSFDRELDKKLRSDVSFATGSADLNKPGQEELILLVNNEIKQLIKDWEVQSLYTKKVKKVRITINGYADLQGSANIERRKQYNLDLSAKRAKAVAEVVLQELNNLKGEHNIEIELTHAGRGEEPPPGIEDLTLRNNPNRRVCIVSTYVIPVF